MGFQTCKLVVEHDNLNQEFWHTAMHVAVEAVASLPTLVDEINKVDINHLWLLATNMTRIVQIMLCLMPTSMSSERSFSVLDRVKTKLRNAMGNERILNLEMLTFYP